MVICPGYRGSAESETNTTTRPPSFTPTEKSCLFVEKRPKTDKKQQKAAKNDIKTKIIRERRQNMASNEKDYPFISISELKPYPNNARQHPQEQINKIVNSINEFGFITPVIIDENNMILVGHGRTEAAKMAGLDKVPFRRVTNLSDDQKRAYILADNKLSDLAEWDEGLLMEELDKIELDMSEFGFDEFEIDLDEDAEIKEDEIPQPPKEPKAKVGDLYQLGEHRLLCGDSTDINDIERLVNGGFVDMVFTDPPYGYNYQSNMRTQSEKFDVIENDDKILDFFPNLSGIVKGFVMICTTWKVLDKWLPLFEKYFDMSNMIIWDKGGGGIGDLKHTFLTDYEIILCSNNGAEIQQKRIGSVWEIGKDSASEYIHPTQKPVGLSAHAIKHTTKKGASVLDLFGGSGSTLMACEQLNRKCYMMELDPRYVDVIIERWENMTGEKAELLEGK